MKKLGVIFPALYFLFGGFVFASELYIRIFDIENFEMVSLALFYYLSRLVFW